ncbi:MAG: M28 family peptidase [Baekduia sp.]
MLWSAQRDAAAAPEHSRWRRAAMLLVAPLTVVLLLGALAALGLWPFAGEASERPRAAAAEPKAGTKRFDVSRAMATARMQTEAGPRPAGSAVARKVGERLRKMLPAGRFEAVPGHPGLRNIVGSVAGSGPVLVVASHYDTLTYPKGHLGGNNAAAAVGAVIELARFARSADRPEAARGIRFVLFDGEQQTSRDSSRFYELGLRGSKAYVRAHAEEVEALVLLDYIGNRNLRLPREGTSDPGLWKQVRSAAAAAGVGSVFPDEVGESVLDDTTPFQQAGIATANFIDWNDPHRHKLSDTYDKLSPASVDAVGETVAQLIVDRDRAAAAGRQTIP